MRIPAGALLPFVVLFGLATPSAAEMTMRFAEHEAMRVDGALISAEPLGEDDITCPEICAANAQCVAAREEAGLCSLLSSVTADEFDPAFKGKSFVGARVEMSELRRDRTAELAFLHPDHIRRADRLWQNLPLVDGPADGILNDAAALLEQGESGRAEPLLRAAFAGSPTNSAVWRKGAEQLLAALAVHRPKDAREAEGLHEMAASAAVNAYLTALDTFERNGALAVLADALAQASDYASAAAAGRYRLTFAEDGAFEASVEAWEDEAKNQPKAPAPGGNLRENVGAWSLSCDNARNCTATAFAVDEYEGYARVDLWRDAGPGSALHAAVYTQFEDQALLSLPAENLFFDGQDDSTAILEPLSWRKEEGFASILPLSADVPQFVDLIVRSDEMFVRKQRGGEVLAMVTIAGAKEALGFIDAHQGRKGVEAPLYAPQPPSLPVVSPEMLEPSLITTPAPVAVLDAWKAACDEADFITENGQASPVGHRMADGLDLWLILCTSGAYNFGSMAFLDRAGEVAQVLFDRPGSEGLIADDDHIWNADVVQAFNDIAYEEPTADAPGPKPFILHSYSRGRGIGDCGIIAQHVWDGERFRLFEQARMDDCKGWREPWPVDWRSTQFGGRAGESENEAKADDGIPLSEAQFSPAYDQCANDPAADTAAQIACADAEARFWDKRLNAAYKAFGAANPGLAPAAKAAQRVWIKSRDANCGFLYALSGNGTMGSVASAHCLARETALRAEFLGKISGEVQPQLGGSPLIDGALSHFYADCAADPDSSEDCVGEEQESWIMRASKARKAISANLDAAAAKAFSAAEALWQGEQDLTCALEGAALSGGEAAYAKKLSAHCGLIGAARRAVTLERWAG